MEKTKKQGGKNRECGFEENSEERDGGNIIEGRHGVTEAFRSGRTIDKLYILEGCQDGPILTIKREAKKQDTIICHEGAAGAAVGDRKTPGSGGGGCGLHLCHGGGDS